MRLKLSFGHNVASYNVVFGSMTTPEQLGEMFKPYNLDIIGLSEVPRRRRESSGNGTQLCQDFICKYLQIVTWYNRTCTAGKPSRLLEPCFGCTSYNKDRRRFNRILLVAYLWFRWTQRQRPCLPTCDRDRAERDDGTRDCWRIGDEAMNAIEAPGMKPTWKDLKIEKEFTIWHNVISIWVLITSCTTIVSR